MLTEILSDVMSALHAGGVYPVYSAFDSKALANKGRGIFTVAGIGKTEGSAPVYSGFSVYFPFKADVEICVTAPEDMPMETLLSYYTDKVQPALASSAGTESALKSMTVRMNTNISRLVLTAVIEISGVYKTERSTR